MSTAPRMTAPNPGEHANIETIRRHAPEVKAAFDTMYATLLGGGVVGMDIKEAVRLRNARVNDCGL